MESMELMARALVVVSANILTKHELVATSAQKDGQRMRTVRLPQSCILVMLDSVPARESR